MKRFFGAVVLLISLCSGQMSFAAGGPGCAGLFSTASTSKKAGITSTLRSVALMAAISLSAYCGGPDSLITPAHSPSPEISVFARLAGRAADWVQGVLHPRDFSDAIQVSSPVETGTTNTIAFAGDTLYLSASSSAPFSPVATTPDGKAIEKAVTLPDGSSFLVSAGAVYWFDGVNPVLTEVYRDFSVEGGGANISDIGAFGYWNQVNQERAGTASYFAKGSRIYEAFVDGARFIVDLDHLYADGVSHAVTDLAVSENGGGYFASGQDAYVAWGGGTYILGRVPGDAPIERVVTTFRMNGYFIAGNQIYVSRSLGALTLAGETPDGSPVGPLSVALNESVYWASGASLFVTRDTSTRMISQERHPISRIAASDQVWFSEGPNLFRLDLSKEDPTVIQVGTVDNGLPIDDLVTVRGTGRVIARVGDQIWEGDQEGHLVKLTTVPTDQSVIHIAGSNEGAAFFGAEDFLGVGGFKLTQ